MGKRTQFWSKVAPFFLSAVLFLSVFFTVVSPMPLLISRLKTKAPLWWLALVTNTAIIALLQPGLSSVFFYGATVGVIAAVFPVFALSKKITLPYAGLLTLACVGAVAICGGMLVSVWQGDAAFQLPWPWLEREIAVSVDAAKQVLSFDAAELIELKARVLKEMPNSLVLFAAVLIWVNASILIRYNIHRFRDRVGASKDLLVQFKVPELWVWPALALTAAAYFLTGPIADLSRVGMTVFLVFYATQGLSVITFYFERFKLGPWGRSLILAAVLFFALPLIPAVGFFDLWFDFRAKVRQ